MRKNVRRYADRSGSRDQRSTLAISSARLQILHPRDCICGPNFTEREHAGGAAPNLRCRRHSKESLATGRLAVTSTGRMSAELDTVVAGNLLTAGVLPSPVSVVLYMWFFIAPDVATRT